MRYLERKDLFSSRHPIDRDGKRCRCDDRRKAGLIKILRAMRRKLQPDLLETII